LDGVQNLIEKSTSALLEAIYNSKILYVDLMPSSQRLPNGN
jgi:hypothetical protein